MQVQFALYFLSTSSMSVKTSLSTVKECITHFTTLISYIRFLLVTDATVYTHDYRDDGHMVSLFIQQL